MVPRFLRLSFFASLLLLAAWLVAPARPVGGKTTCPAAKGADAELLWESLSHQIGSNVGM
jgi:hypothetical protein